MGSNQSTRTITVTNDDLSFITLSESLIKRMVGEGGEESSGSDRSDNQQKGIAAPAPPAPTRGWAEEPKQGHIIEGYSPISSIQLRREVEAAKASVEKYWQRRVHSIKVNEDRASAVEEDNFKRGIAEVQKAFKGYNTAHYENPCTDKVSIVTQCYKDNPRQPLNCHNEVKAFSACVEQKHRNIMQART